MIHELIFQSLDKITIVTIVLVILIFLLLHYRTLWWKNSEPKPPKVPGPRSVPLLGTSWMFYFGGYELNKMHEFYDEIHNRYGPIAKEEAFFNIPIYNIFERKDIEKVLKAPSKYPVRPPTEALATYRYSRPDRYASAGLVNEQGEKWHFLRTSLTAELMSPRTMVDFQDEVYNLVEDWCNLLNAKKGPKHSIENMENIVVQLAIETSCALVLGRRLGFLCPDLVPLESMKLAENLQNHFAAIRDTQYSFPLWKYFNTTAYRTMVECESYIYETVSKMIEDFADENNEANVYNSLMNAKIDEREKTAAVIDFIAAGIHTLKNSLLFLFYLVAKHPELQKKIIGDLNYAKACMTESFRLLPTATPLARILDQDMEIAGYQLKSGSVVLCHNSVACRKEENFTSPNDFIPERWLGEERHKTLSSNLFLVTPFGSGRRICPGKRFIELVLPIFLQQTVEKFEITTDHVLELQFEFLRAPKGPISMSFKSRD